MWFLLLFFAQMPQFSLGLVNRWNGASTVLAGSILILHLPDQGVPDLEKI